MGRVASSLARLSGFVKQFSLVCTAIDKSATKWCTGEECSPSCGQPGLCGRGCAG